MMCTDVVIECIKMYAGMDISPIDLINIESFSRRVISLAEFRQMLHNYLRSKMDLVAPNLSTLIGEQVKLCSSFLAAHFLQFQHRLCCGKIDHTFLVPLLAGVCDRSIDVCLCACRHIFFKSLLR